MLQYKLNYALKFVLYMTPSVNANRNIVRYEDNNYKLQHVKSMLLQSNNVV